MLKSHKILNASSLNQSKESSIENSKKYRCGCCNDKKYHDYNRQNRLRRESASSKRLNFTSRQSIDSGSKENLFNLPNTSLINSIDNFEIRAKSSSCIKNLSSIMEASPLIEKDLKKDKKSSQKSPIIDMKSYCQDLFSSEKKKVQKHRIEIILDGQVHFIEFNSSEKMKLALGQLKLLIEKQQLN